MRAMHLQYLETDRRLAGPVESTVLELGIPQSPLSAAILAERLLFPVLEERQRLHALEVNEIKKAHPGLYTPPFPTFMPIAFLRKEVMDAADTPESEINEDVFISGLAARVGRLARDGSRYTVLKTAEYNEVKWARQTPGTTCAFCSMLASRGPVWNVKKFRSHNGCDCTAVVVPDPNADWDGKREAQRLKELWRHAGNMGKFRELLKEQVVLA